MDNLSNSKQQITSQVEKITGKSIKFYKQDVNDKAGLEYIISKHSDIQVVLHFAAALKLASQSISKRKSIN